MKKPYIKFGKLQQVIDGKAYYWKRRIDGAYVEVSVCCDCNLVHTIEMKPTKTAMRVKVWREDEATDKLRAKKK